MLESDLKRAVQDFLQYQKNLGSLFFLRLNAGNFIAENPDGSHRMIRGVESGTADYLILAEIKDYPIGLTMSISSFPFAIFLELKGEKGKQSEAQVVFQSLVEKHGAEYWLIREIEELESRLTELGIIEEMKP